MEIKALAEEVSSAYVSPKSVRGVGAIQNVWLQLHKSASRSQLYFNLGAGQLISAGCSSSDC